MGWPKMLLKPTHHGEVFCAMVRAAAACFVVVVWLSYDTQDVEHNAPTTPKPGKQIPPPGKGIKQPTVNSNHM
jgi:hypothetical protein